MNLNLSTLREEMAEYAASLGLAVFQSTLRSLEADDAIYWDADRVPDYRQFLAAAIAAGVRLVTIFSRELTGEYLETLAERLEEAGIERAEKRILDRRLRELRPYQGFIGQVEMSFNLSGRDYVFETHTDWFDDLSDLIAEIRASAEEFEDESEDEGPMGPYFTRN
jgi:hypothetical protein